MSRLEVCFIDDDAEFEIPLFARAFSDTFDVVAGTGLAQCLAEMEGRGAWVPDLFVLDLYFPSAEPDRAAVEALSASRLDLPADGASIRAAYGNHLKAGQRYRAVLGAWALGPEGGLALAGDVHAAFPNVPIVFYSRKATSDDILDCLSLQGVVDVIAKPTGADDADTRTKTLAAREIIAGSFADAVAAFSSEAGRETMADTRRAAARMAGIISKSK